MLVVYTFDKLDLTMLSNSNCPKYINLRDTIPHSFTSPKIVHRRLNLAPDDRLPQDIITLILEADTVFFGTSYEAHEEDETLFPSHVGMNHRGGRQGFIRVVPSDGRTVVIPDYSGRSLRILTAYLHI